MALNITLSCGSPKALETSLARTDYVTTSPDVPGPLRSGIRNRRRPVSDTDMHPATAKWYDRRDTVFIEFCVVDSKDVKVNFDKTKFGFSCVGGKDNVRHENQIDLFEAIDENESKHKRTDRSVLCVLRKAQPGVTWTRLTKEKEKIAWLKVDLNNYKNWAEDSDEENYDQFPDLMHNMDGEDMPDVDDDVDDEDSDDEKIPDLE
ncbi:hypothetical protein WMY93_030071 [Mugilogobius chulae]|uniref:Prostaglandin E synthase 3 n=1 Tax=Mugilogobius chulae TaxID=88201 RepID=A0AAW0MR89_9GOBI